MTRRKNLRSTKTNFKMKKTILAATLSVVTIFAFAKTSAALSECCTVTVSNNSTGDSATVTRCATHVSDACDLAYKKAKAAIK
jgi:hypothetical protein